MHSGDPDFPRIARFLLLMGLFFIALIWLVPQAGTAKQFRLYGVAEDDSRIQWTRASHEKTELICDVGFNAVRHTVPWVLRQKDLNRRDYAALRNAIDAAWYCNLTVILTVYPYHDRDKNPKMPTTSTEQRLFADFVEYLAREFPEVRHWEVGNEPNWSFFWWPQFKPDGSDAAIRAYFGLLALTYDKLKAINPENIVIGGALASVGEDDPNAQRKRHSPTRSIELLGKYYQESGRISPIMDWVSIHPYPERPGEALDQPHPTTTTIGFADYPKLVKLLGEAFDGTAQLGSALPILWSEYGVDSIIPVGKAHLYKGQETSYARAVTEEVQGDRYRQAIELTRCQLTVVGVFLFHAVDDAKLAGLGQSGIYYADEKIRAGGDSATIRNTPKKSQPVVKKAIQEVQNSFLC